MLSYRDRNRDILDKQDSLSLNNEKIDKFMDIANHAIESSLGDGVVSTRAHLGSKTVAHDGLTGNLSGNGDGESHEGQLESPTNDIEVPGGEDERDNGGVCDSRGTCQSPRRVSKK